MTTTTATKTNIYRVKAHGNCAATTIRVTFDLHDRTAPIHDRATFNMVLSGYVNWSALVRCDGCDNTYRVTGTPVRGKVNTTKACTARCMSATNGDCECECGGERHGLNHA
jgi:hypothetical protein